MLVFNISQLNLVFNLEKIKQNKLLNLIKNFVGSGFFMCTSKMFKISPDATVLCGLVHMPVPHVELFFVNAKAESGLNFDPNKQYNKYGLPILSAFLISLINQ